eukprot:TRINITY_DN17590_c0_g1_i1.p1 TRINITY_DN17590_c0_g1~~TRINITY_DN17590_c0_g1_i1.p1  ORF type:complete len:180 (+),score=21.65 TRINITY_DN17590_c0_g1_i1:664-1203(+)
MSFELDRTTSQITRSLSLKLFIKAKEGDEFLRTLSYPEREAIQKVDQWRMYSPYQENDLSFNLVWYYVVRMISKMVIDEECSILTLIYIDRFMSHDSNPVFCTQNIFPIITAAYVLACKVHQECHVSLLGELSEQLSFFSVRLLKTIERMFLIAVDYRLHVGKQQFVAYAELIDLENPR